MSIASITKLLTSSAALQLVERNAIGPDKNVSVLISTLGDEEFLYGRNETGQPLTRKRTNAITLQSLLTHNSGVSYDISNSELARCTVHKERVINSGDTVNDRFG